MSPPPSPTLKPRPTLSSPELLLPLCLTRGQQRSHFAYLSKDFVRQTLSRQRDRPISANETSSAWPPPRVSFFFFETNSGSARAVPPDLRFQSNVHEQHTACRLSCGNFLQTGIVKLLSLRETKGSLCGDFSPHSKPQFQHHCCCCHQRTALTGKRKKKTNERKKDCSCRLLYLQVFKASAHIEFIFYVLSRASISQPYPFSLLFLRCIFWGGWGVAF